MVIDSQRPSRSLSSTAAASGPIHGTRALKVLDTSLEIDYGALFKQKKKKI